MGGEGFCNFRNSSLTFALLLLSLPGMIQPTSDPHTPLPGKFLWKLQQKSLTCEHITHSPWSLPSDLGQNVT